MAATFMSLVDRLSPLMRLNSSRSRPSTFSVASRPPFSGSMTHCRSRGWWRAQAAVWCSLDSMVECLTRVYSRSIATSIFASPSSSPASRSLSGLSPIILRLPLSRVDAPMRLTPSSPPPCTLTDSLALNSPGPQALPGLEPYVNKRSRQSRLHALMAMATRVSISSARGRCRRRETSASATDSSDRRARRGPRG